MFKLIQVQRETMKGTLSKLPSKKHAFRQEFKRFFQKEKIKREGEGETKK